MAVTKFGYENLELCEFSVYAIDMQPLPWERNVALGKQTWQVDTRLSFSSERAVDGNILETSCMQTKAASDRWWMVDLGKEERLTRVRLYNLISDPSSCKTYYSENKFSEPHNIWRS